MKRQHPDLVRAAQAYLGAIALAEHRRGAPSSVKWWVARKYRFSKLALEIADQLDREAISQRYTRFGSTGVALSPVVLIEAKEKAFLEELQTYNSFGALVRHWRMAIVSQWDIPKNARKMNPRAHPPYGTEAERHTAMQRQLFRTAFDVLVDDLRALRSQPARGHQPLTRRVGSADGNQPQVSRRHALLVGGGAIAAALSVDPVREALEGIARRAAEWPEPPRKPAVVPVPMVPYAGRPNAPLGGPFKTRNGGVANFSLVRTTQPGSRQPSAIGPIEVIAMAEVTTPGPLRTGAEIELPHYVVNMTFWWSSLGGSPPKPSSLHVNDKPVSFKPTPSDEQSHRGFGPIRERISAGPIPVHQGSRVELSAKLELLDNRGNAFAVEASGIAVDTTDPRHPVLESYGATAEPVKLQLDPPGQGLSLER